jgi:hypothetical protein
MDTHPPFFGQPGQPVPSVDPNDLKTVFEFFHETATQSQGGQTGVSVEIFQRLCKPGADISAVTYRAMMLGSLTNPKLPEEFSRFWKEQLAPWTTDGHFDTVIYREFAQLPMEWMGLGVIRQGFPFDAELLLRRLRGSEGRVRS